MRHVLVHDYYRISENQIRYVIEDNLNILLEQVNRYLTETDWKEWERNEQAKAESTIHKSLIQSVQKMKKDGLTPLQIARYTGLAEDEIEKI